ncbi:MAG: CotH kinase family protein [Bacteroidota bacterium]|nr:CotH kinase family protein [Bacteroidota bacterium]
MRTFLFIIFLLSGLASPAQTGSAVFNDSIMHTLEIETDLPDWFDTLENDFALNFANPELYPERYHKCKITWDGTILYDCGFREKGNASNTLTQFGRKKPLKISFDEFVNQDLDGLKKINLSNFTNDPSLLHDVISFKLFRDAGLIASRTSFTKVWVNDEFIGLYVVIENVDKRFLKFNYGSSMNDGNLYKTDRGASVPLNWVGTESAVYKDQGLKLTTNETADDWTKLISFIDNINNNSSPDFKTYLEANFDVHSYLKILAIEKCIRSWDSYWGGGNNFHLYEHPDGMYRWIPWDMNETFQDIKILSGTSLLDGYLVPANKFDDRPLLKRIFEVEEWKTEYLDYVCQLVQNNYTLEHLGQFILDQHNLADEAYKIDPNKYNTYASFENSLTDYNQDAVSLTHSGYVLRINYPGIYPFIHSQREWAVKQMSGWNQSCSIASTDIYDLSIFPNPAGSYVNISNVNTGFDYAQFRLYDFTGKLFRATEFELRSGAFNELTLEGVPSGIYVLIKLSADGKMGRSKLIVQ